MSLATPAPPPSGSLRPRQWGDNARSTMQLAGGFFVCLNFEQKSKATKERARKAQCFASYQGWPESYNCITKGGLVQNGLFHQKDVFKTKMKEQMLA